MVFAGMPQTDAALKLILPVGISFYAFQKIGYIVDLFRGTVQGERSFLRYALFVSFFPKLVAGPIVSARLFLPQLQTDQRPEWNRIVNGLELMLQGFFKKAVIANSLGVIVDHCFARPELQTSLTLIIGAVFIASDL
jgi:D-alanyl-lipoteichoic acid acyltransferase DltB (MBOAT superfamily)